MVFNLISIMILYIALVALQYLHMVGVRTKCDKLAALCCLGSAVVGILLGVALTGMVFI